jgi:hypothetical protein
VQFNNFLRWCAKTYTCPKSKTSPRCGWRW